MMQQIKQSTITYIHSTDGVDEKYKRNGKSAKTETTTVVG